MEKSFTEKLMEFLMKESMPQNKGNRAEESGLIIAIAKNKNPLCASFGSSLDMAKITLSAMEQIEGVKEMLLLAVGAYMVIHSADEYVMHIMEQMKS